MASSSGSGSSNTPPLFPPGLEFSSINKLLAYYDSYVNILTIVNNERIAAETADELAPAPAALTPATLAPAVSALALAGGTDTNKKLKKQAKVDHANAKAAEKQAKAMASSRSKPKSIRTPLSYQQRVNSVHYDYFDVLRPVTEITIKDDLTKDDAKNVLCAVAMANEKMEDVHIKVTLDPTMAPEKLQSLLKFCAGMSHFYYRVGKEGKLILADGPQIEDDEADDQVVVGQIDDGLDEGQTDE